MWQEKKIISHFFHTDSVNVHNLINFFIWISIVWYTSEWDKSVVLSQQKVDK